MDAVVRCPQAINIYKFCRYSNKKARIVQSWKKENNTAEQHEPKYRYEQLFKMMMTMTIDDGDDGDNNEDDDDD